MRGGVCEAPSLPLRVVQTNVTSSEVMHSGRGPGPQRHLGFAYHGAPAERADAGWLGSRGEARGNPAVWLRVRLGHERVLVWQRALVRRFASWAGVPCIGSGVTAVRVGLDSAQCGR